MSNKLTVWIVEDSVMEACQAWKVVKEVYGEDTAVYWTGDFNWPPKLRDAPRPERETVDPTGYPDIVVLDLCKRTSAGESLQGDFLYAKFRTWEKQKTKGRPAFVIIWSLYRGWEETADFVKTTVTGDNWVIPVDTKRPELLRTALVGLQKRVAEQKAND